MTHYIVRWEIDMEDVDSPEEAAARALIVHRDPESVATVFDVKEKKPGARWKRVDLNPEVW